MCLPLNYKGKVNKQTRITKCNTNYLLLIEKKNKLNKVTYGSS